MENTKTIWSNYKKDLRSNVEGGRKVTGLEEIEQLELEMKRVYGKLQEIENRLDKSLEGKIFVILKRKTVQGVQLGYKVLGGNLKNILYSNYPEYKVVIANQNVKGCVRHKLGEDEYEFREIRVGKGIRKLIKKIEEQEEVTRSTLNYYTKGIVLEVEEALRE